MYVCMYIYKFTDKAETIKTLTNRHLLMNRDTFRY